MRFRYIALAIIGLAFTQPAQAASKFEVGSKGCMSLEQARAKHPNAHLKYRLIQADKCWYDEATFAKAKPVHKNRVAGEGAVPSTHAAESRATPAESARGQPATRDTNLDENLNDELDGIFLVLCGGVCPQLSVPNTPSQFLKRR